MEGVASTHQFKDWWDNGCFIDIYMILRTQFFTLSFQDPGLSYVRPLKLDRCTPRRKVCVCARLCVQSLSCVWLFATPWTVVPPRSSVHGIFQARIVEWVAISFSKRSSWPRDQTWVSCTTGRFFVWATREAHLDPYRSLKALKFKVVCKTMGT